MLAWKEGRFRAHHLPCVETLLQDKEKIDVSLKDAQGRTALDLAATEVIRCQESESLPPKQKQNLRLSPLLTRVSFDCMLIHS